MRLLILSPKAPWVPGGIEKVVKETATRLLESGNITLEIWCKGPKNETVFWNGLKVRMFKSILGLSPNLIKELKKSQSEFDIIHIHGTSNLYPLEVLLAIDEWEKVVVSSHYHPYGSTLLFRLTKPVYDRLIVSQYLRNVKKVVCVSNVEKRAIISKFKIPRDKTRVIPNGVSVSQIKSLKSGRRPRNGISILYFGRLEKYKNIHIILEALKYLPSTFVLYIVGRGLYEKELRRLTKRLNLESRVKFLGFLPEDELYALLNSVDIVVNLSEIEAFGIMVIESLAAGKPVVVNDKLGLKELAEHFPRCMIPMNNPTPETVAKVIKAVSSDRATKVEGLERFEWDTILKSYLREYWRGKQ